LSEPASDGTRFHLRCEIDPTSDRRAIHLSAAAMDSETCFDLFMWKFGIGRNVRLEKTSGDPELGKYYDHLGSLGATYMDVEGTICITIHDAGGATASTWYEELMHAKQFIDRGQVSVGIGGTMAEREVEVAVCLIEHAQKLALTQDEIVRAERARDHYSKQV
jgi:hypothetical protein